MKCMLKIMIQLTYSEKKCRQEQKSKYFRAFFYYLAHLIFKIENS